MLIAEPPYECYATEDGRLFEPLAGLSSRLAQENVRIDFLHKLPASLSDYRTILLAGSIMAQLTPAQTARLENFVASGGVSSWRPMPFSLPRLQTRTAS